MHIQAGEDAFTGLCISPPGARSLPAIIAPFCMHRSGCISKPRVRMLGDIVIEYDRHPGLALGIASLRARRRGLETGKDANVELHNMVAPNTQPFKHTHTHTERHAETVPQSPAHVPNCGVLLHAFEQQVPRNVSFKQLVALGSDGQDTVSRL